jgi:predicted ATPase/DNA-binding SARP family transcriptional activator
VLVEMFWPETDLGAGRHNLSNALSAIRHVLEPPGVQPGAVLQADRTAVRLNPAAVTTDAARFEALARRCVDPREPERERAALVHAAAAEYGGRLLPGFYEEWITPEAERLAGLFLRLTRDAAPLLRAQGELDLLLSCAQRAATDDPWSEEAVQLLMEALAAVGDPSRAARHYRDFERRLREDLGAEPAPGLQQYAAELSRVRRKASASPEPQPERRVTESSSSPPAEPAAGEESALRGTAFAALTVTRLFDREEETRLLAELLRAPRARLVTLTGPGGTGKTRLALETGRRLVGAEQAERSQQEGRPTSVTFVPLAELGEGERVPDVLLRSLGLVPQPGRDPLEQAADALDREAAPLLVLDNFEHLVETGARHVSSLLGRVPRARCLVTSRQKLLIEGERELPLSPLPTVARDETLEALAATPGIQLFVDRAQMIRPDFQLTPRNAGVVAELCAHLEGLPLAVELAAARVSLLTPAQILEGIRRDRLDFLVSRRRDAVARQRSLRATLDWSYELLSKAARRFLAQLSVFRAGWTLEAAVAVCDARGEEECLELLSLLRDASLINVEHREEGLRFSLMETVRQYAAERLTAAGEMETLWRGHARYFTELAERESRLYHTAHHAEAMVHLGTEHENLRAAIEWSIEAEEHELRARLGGALATFWKMNGYVEQALAWFADVVMVAETVARRCALTELTPRVALARLVSALSILAGDSGNLAQGAALCEWALALAEESGDPSARALAVLTSALDPRHGGPAGMLAVVEEGLRLARQAGHASLTARALQYKSYLLERMGQEAEGAEAGAEALALFRALGDPMGIGDALRFRGFTSLQHPDRLGAARRDLEENLAIRRRIGDRPGVALALGPLGVLSRQEGDLRQARAHLEDAAAVFEACGWSNSSHNAAVLQELAEVAREQQRAAEVWGLKHRGVRILLQCRLFMDAAACLEELADLAVQAGDAVRAARLAGAADRLRPLGGSRVMSPESRVARLALDLAGVLGPEACEREMAAGRRLSDAAVLDLAESAPV